MSPLAGFGIFVLFVIMSASLAINGYYYTNISTINDEIFQATRLTSEDSLGLGVDRTKSLTRSIIRERQELERENLALGQRLEFSECKLAPYQKGMETLGEIGSIIGSLNPFTIITQGPSIVSKLNETIDLTRRANSDCR